MWGFITDFTVAAKSGVEELKTKATNLEAEVASKNSVISIHESTIQSQSEALASYSAQSAAYENAIADYDRVVGHCSELMQGRTAAEQALKEFAATAGFPLSDHSAEEHDDAKVEEPEISDAAEPPEKGPDPEPETEAVVSDEQVKDEDVDDFYYDEA